MKNQLRILITLCILALTTITANAFDYYITFTGSGASTTVDSVVIQNLSKGTKVTVPAGTQFRLYDTESGINDFNATSNLAYVYPNPMTGDATFTFSAKNGGNTQITVYKLDGTEAAGLDAEVPQGNNSFQLSLPTGMYIIQAKGNDFSYTAKTISISTSTSEPKINFSGNAANIKKPQRAPAPEVKLQYSTGDLLLYKGYSGNYCTIVTDKPTETKITDFKFVDCTDADGYHYAVVHIGSQTWMAENLKTTKYQNGELINSINTTKKDFSDEANPKYQSGFNNDENNAAKYGRLYTWYAANDSRRIAPAGWHVPTINELTTLQSYLMRNGYNDDGTTTSNSIAKSLLANTDWLSYSVMGSTYNKSGFTALPGGIRGSEGYYNNLKSAIYWWSSTEESIYTSEMRFLYYNNPDLLYGNTQKNISLSVRCILGELSTIKTTLVTGIDSTSAICGGEITNQGTSEITKRGVCWNINISNPTIFNSKTSEGAGAGSFTSNLTGLVPGTKYYVRAYATNSEGTVYGNEFSFTTKNTYDNEIVKDIDGNIYHTIKIGTQTWMVENLNTTRYRNGDSIYTTYPSNKDITGETSPKYQWTYNGNDENTNVYGRLYTWYTLDDERYIAPEGWHVPTIDELTVLQNYLIENGYNFDGTIKGNKIAKSLASTYNWESNTLTGMIGNDLQKNNSSRFSTLPGGYRNVNGSFDKIGSAAYLWSSINENDIEAWCSTLDNDDYGLNKNKSPMSSAYSVRCIKDVMPTVKTIPITDIDSITAISGGEIISSGASKVIKSGVCWSRDKNPTIKNGITSDSDSIGLFSSNIKPILPGTTYYVRAFATNSKGTGYGKNIIFTTKPAVSKYSDPVVDIDGNIYQTVKIGNQIWMSENLRTTRYRNGDLIGTTLPANKDINGETTPKYQWTCNGNESYAKTYGRLYTWYAVVDERFIAPEGWHVASHEEWNEMENYLIANGHNYDCTVIGENIAKSLAVTTGWNSTSGLSNGSGAIYDDLSKNNSSGFSAVPGGIRFLNNFANFGIGCTWWTSTEHSSKVPWYRGLYFSYDVVETNYFYSKKFGFSVRCVKDELPILTTINVSSIENTTALSGGEFSKKGNLTITKKGVCWSLNKNPTIEDSKTIDGGGIISFSSYLTGLLPDTTYYIRAYAICSSKVIYGNEVSFDTKEVINEQITDIDGNVYNTVRIGSQTWMVENLKTTHYRNGDLIGTTTPTTKDISTEIEPKYQWAYDGDEINVAKYGRLYTWYAATDSRNIAPEGWHVPTDSEWTTLENYLGGYSIAGGKMKVSGTNYWFSPNTGASNESGFSALPSGWRFVDHFTDIGRFAFWWSSSPWLDIYHAATRSISYSDRVLYNCCSNPEKNSGLSIRCIKD